MNKNQIFAVSLVMGLTVSFTALVIVPMLLFYIYNVEKNFYAYAAPGLASVASILIFKMIKRCLVYYYLKKDDSRHHSQ
jgi:uncharacterized membrane protein YqjE